MSLHISGFVLGVSGLERARPIPPLMHGVTRTARTSQATAPPTHAAVHRTPFSNALRHHQNAMKIEDHFPKFNGNIPLDAKIRNKSFRLDVAVYVSPLSCSNIFMSDHKNIFVHGLKLSMVGGYNCGHTRKQNIERCVVILFLPLLHKDHFV